MVDNVIWDTINELSYLVGDMEKLEFMANSIHDTAAESAKATTGQERVENAILFYHSKDDIRIAAAILLDQLGDFQDRLAKVEATVETWYFKNKENNTPRKEYRKEIET